MTAKIFYFLKAYGYETERIDRLIISTYIYINEIKFEHNILLSEYLIKSTDTEYIKLQEFVNLVKEQTIAHFGFEELIELFEFVISPADKEVNGAVYTPVTIRSFILKDIFEKFSNTRESDLTYADIACGCGSFLIDIAKHIRAKTSISFDKIFRNCLYGLDIQNYSIIRTKLLLTLLAISEGEDLEEFDFNLYVGNALNFDWRNHIGRDEANGVFDIIVGNPPYVGASKIDADTRSLLINWSVSSVGKADLYISFFQVGLSWLKDGGILGYITVNSFFKSLNGRALRAFLSNGRFSILIVDFKGEQIFKRRSTYTCICIIQKNKNNCISYTASSSSNLSKINKKSFIDVPFTDLDNEQGWLLRDKTVTKNILKIQRAGKPLGELFEIRNGFATLQNNIYLFKPLSEDAEFFYFQKDGADWRVERGICKPAIKPNIIKTEDDIIHKREMLIFPYTQTRKDDLFDKSISIKLFSENFFKENFPYAYLYLEAGKSELAKRDNGNKTYENWFAFGRNQALTLTGSKLLFPYISNHPYFVFTDEQDLLFYNGYAILSKSNHELLILKKILNSPIFWYYIVHASKPYENEYYALAKNYIKHFGVCYLTDKEKVDLLNFDEAQVNALLSEKYNIQI